MSETKEFSSLNGYKVKDATARGQISDHEARIRSLEENGGGSGGEGGVQLPQEYLDYLAEQTYKAPDISTFTLSGFSAADAEVGTKLTFTGFTHAETNLDNISGDLSLKHNGNVIKSDIAKSATSVSISHSLNETIRTEGMQRISLEGTNSKGVSFSKAYVKTFYLPMYYALSASSSSSSIQSLGVTNLGKKVAGKEYEVTVSGTKYIYFASPTAITKVTSQGYDVPTVDLGTQSISVNGVATSYYIYRTADTTIAGTYNFKFE